MTVYLGNYVIFEVVTIGYNVKLDIYGNNAKQKQRNLNIMLYWRVHVCVGNSLAWFATQLQSFHQCEAVSQARFCRKPANIWRELRWTKSADSPRAIQHS